MEFKTRSGYPFNSTAQREHYEKLKSEAFKGLEQHLGDPELHKLPVFGVFRDYRLFQKFDFVDRIPQITPMQLFLNNYKEFTKNCEDLRYIVESKLACKDISVEEHDYIIKEIEMRELYMESQLNPSKKKSFNNLFKNEEEKRTFYSRMGNSIVYSAKVFAGNSSNTIENSSSETTVQF
tara:strand:- start:9 stop:545 length:537 start_codon:yes stop_codon:yes gene_type:complete